MRRPGPSEFLLSSANAASTTAASSAGNYVNYASLDQQYLDDSGSSNWTDILPISPVSSSDQPDAESPASSVERPTNMPIITMVCILSTAFSYGCTLTTLFLITLPMECERIHQSHPGTPKSVALGTFVAVAGLTQLVSPLVGRLSDTYAPPPRVELDRHRRHPPRWQARPKSPAASAHPALCDQRRFLPPHGCAFLPGCALPAAHSGNWTPASARRAAARPALQ